MDRRNRQKFLAETMFATLMEGEFPATVKVLAAVKDDNRDYKPDDEVAHRVGAGDAPGDGRRLVHRQHHQRRSSSGTRRRPSRPSRSSRASTTSSSSTRRRSPRSCRRCARCPADKLTRDGRLLRHHADAARRSSSASPTTTASTTAGSSPRTSARWARRCRPSTARQRRRADAVAGVRPCSVVSRPPRVHRPPPP